MSKWKLKDKNGKYRSRRSFKQDCMLDSDESWEQRRIIKYIGKAIFQTKELAISRANNLKSRGYIAWVKGKTVYNK